MLNKDIQNNIPKTIFDREDRSWGEAVFIQKYKEKILKCLDFSNVDIIKKYIGIHRIMSNHPMSKTKLTNKLHIIINGEEVNIENIEVKFIRIEKSILPICDIECEKNSYISAKYKQHGGNSYLYTAPYVEGVTLRELQGQQQNHELWDLGRNLKSITWSIEDHVTRSLGLDIRHQIIHNQINPVNIKIKEIRGNILHLVVTDIGSSIAQLITDLDKQYPDYFSLDDL